MYESGIGSYICRFSDNWVSLPIKTNYAVLYYNTGLLNKYDMKVPETWEELIDTSQHIYQNENDSNLIPYNGLFDDSETGTCSLYEFFYSFRSSLDSDVDNMFSNESLNNALDTMKEMMDIYGIELLQKGTLFTLGKLNDGNAVFIKYWDTIANSIYGKSILPGGKKGFSGSSIGGQNIAINKIIDDDKIDASIKVIEYLTSYEIRKEYTINNKEYSAIPALYDDPEVCQEIDCEFMKSIQFVSIKVPDEFDYDSYSTFLRKTFIKFFSNEKSKEEIIDELNFKKNYYFITISNSSIGKSYGIILAAIAVIIVASLALPFINGFKKYYNFLYYDFWIISICGSIIMFILCLTPFGEPTKKTCELRMLSFSYGLSFNLVPIMFKLIKSIKNKKSLLWTFIQKQRYIVVSFFILINNILYIVLLASPFSINEKTSKNEINYKECKMNNRTGKIFIYFIYMYIIFILFYTLWLSFLKRADRSIRAEVTSINISLYTYILCVIVIIIANTINIEDYNSKFILIETAYIIFAINNHIILFIIRPIYLHFKKIDEEEITHESLRSNTYSFSSSKVTNSKNNHSKENIINSKNIS
eukprot:jgi/Orpsp1_1/1189179/evm.model.d7180000070058.1